MAQPGPPDAGGPGSSLAERAIGALSEAVASFRAPQPSDADLFESLSQAEKEVLQKHWPDGRPSGGGDSYFDGFMQIRLRRLRWRARVKTGGELTWLLGKLAGIAVVFGIAWQSFVG